MQLDSKTREIDSISLKSSLRDISQTQAQSQVGKNLEISKEEPKAKAEFSKLLDTNAKSGYTKESVAILPQLNSTAVVKTFDLGYALEQYKSQMQTTKEIAYPADNGYKINPQGYLTSSFNRAAGLPDGFKIHYETIKELDKALREQMQPKDVLNSAYARSNPNSVSLSFNEMAGIFRSAWMTFREVAGSEINKAFYFSEKDLESFPVGFATRYGTIHSNVTAVYKTQEQFSKAEVDNKNLVGGLDNGILRLFDKNSFSVDANSWNPHWEFYVNEQSQVSRSGLLVGFLKSHLLQGRDRDVTKSLEYYNLLEGKEDIKSYLESNPQKTLRDYYTFSNNINWDSLSTEEREQTEADFESFAQNFKGYEEVENLDAFIAHIQKSFKDLEALGEEAAPKEEAQEPQGLLEHIEAITLQNDNLISKDEPLFLPQPKLNIVLGSRGVDINNIDSLREKAVQTYILMQSVNAISLQSNQNLFSFIA